MRRYWPVSLRRSGTNITAREQGLDTVWLTVNRHNDAAIAIYEKKDFKKAREQVAGIGNGYVMDDYVMEKEIGATDD